MRTTIENASSVARLTVLSTGNTAPARADLRGGLR
jgi:hypothetical protein